MHRKILWQLQIAYFETYQRFIWLLRKAQFFGYCASIILLLRISQLFMYYVRQQVRQHNKFNYRTKIVIYKDYMFRPLCGHHQVFPIWVIVLQGCAHLRDRGSVYNVVTWWHEKQ